MKRFDNFFCGWLAAWMVYGLIIVTLHYLIQFKSQPTTFEPPLPAGYIYAHTNDDRAAFWYDDNNRIVIWYYNLSTLRLIKCEWPTNQYLQTEQSHSSPGHIITKP